MKVETNAGAVAADTVFRATADALRAVADELVMAAGRIEALRPGGLKGAGGRKPGRRGRRGRPGATS